MARFKFPHDPRKGSLTQRQRITNGLALLDHKLGRGWEILIDLETFDINSGTACVLGQVIQASEVEVYQQPVSSWWFSEEERKELEENDYLTISRPNEYYEFIRDLVTNLNGNAADLLFEADWVANRAEEELDDEKVSDALGAAIGMDGLTIRSSTPWKRVIKKRQIELCGSVEEATKRRKAFFKKQEAEARAAYRAAKQEA